MWIFGKQRDLAFLFIPVWACWLIAFLLPQNLLTAELPLWYWVIIVLLIDVTHVWSTLFRTYLDKQERNNHYLILILAPIVALCALLLLAFGFRDWFWRILAYFALYHFIKQQVGFFALYSAKWKVKLPTAKIRFDKVVLYISMLYPIIFWHFNHRNFNWFVQNDFFEFNNSITAYWPAINGLYFLLLISWLASEISFVKKKGVSINYGRILWLTTTAFNWYLGIVYFNSDMVFTLTNVVAHGIPYLALVVLYQNHKTKTTQKRKWFWLAPIIIIGSTALAYLEEYGWDVFLNHEKTPLFPNPLGGFELSDSMQAIALAMLSLPQVTHYILDGFIWKNNAKNPHLIEFISGHE